DNFVRHWASLRFRSMLPQKLIGTWELNPAWAYSLAVLFLALFTRLILALLRGVEFWAQDQDHKGFWQHVFRYFRGLDPNPEKGDYWVPFILGLLEALAYPVLMVTENWMLVGAWITLKTLAQWEKWKEKRPVFNRFLVGNAVILIGAYVVVCIKVIKLKP